MTQQYTPVTWQDETTSQQGTLINAERLNQMQTAHHYADGFEEVDAVPTANPGVQYHKIVYCTADNTFYRWDGTEWTKDIDDETKALLQQEIARATAAEGELSQDLADETTARETADTAMQADITAMQSEKLDKQTADPVRNITKVYAVTRTTQKMLYTGLGPEHIPQYGYEETLLAKMPTLYDPTADTVVNYGWTTAQIGAEATARAEADTALGNRITAEETRATQAEQANAQAIANTYTKGETDTLLGAKANDNAVVHITGDETVGGIKNFTDGINVPSTGKTSIWAGDSGTFTLNAAGGGYNRITCKNANRTIDLTVDANVLRVPTPPDGASTLGAVNIAYLDGYLPMVRTANNQSIAGVKTFTGQIWAQNTMRCAPVADIRRGVVTLASNRTTEMYFIGNFSDTGDFQIATYQPSYKILLDMTNEGAIIAPNQRAYSAGNTTDVATIGTLDAYTPMVRTTGNQTKAGTLTLTSSPVVELYQYPILLIKETAVGFDETGSTASGIHFYRKGTYSGRIAETTEADGSVTLDMLIKSNVTSAAKEGRLQVYEKTDHTFGMRFWNGTAWTTLVA